MGVFSGAMHSVKGSSLRGHGRGDKKVAREPLNSLDTVSRSQSHTRRKLGLGQEEGGDPHLHRTGRGGFQGI